MRDGPLFASRRRISEILLAIAVSLVSLIPRFASSFVLENYLWAEDGYFADEATALGARSLLNSYAGYIHTYPRLIAMGASYVPLSQTPMIFFAGWLIAYLTMACTIFVVSREAGLSLLYTLALVAFTSLQPSGGEVFFNITNAQWLLGASLALWLSYRSQLPTPMVPVLAVACLTGPFILFFFPVAILSALLFRRHRQNARPLMIAALGACIQGLIFFRSARLGGGASNLSWRPLAEALFSALIFGANTPVTYVAAAVFWIATSLGVYTFIASDKTDSAVRKQAAMIMLAGLGTLLAGLVASKDTLSVMVGSLNRYVWVPYTLFFCAAALMSNSARLAKPALFMAMGTLCCAQFRQVSWPTALQYKAFAEFSRYKEGISIPINPAWWRVYPGWHMAGRGPDSDLASHRTIEYDLRALSGATASPTHELFLFSANSPITFDRRITCDATRTVGVEIELLREEPSFAKLYWSYDGAFDGRRSLSRFYPAGVIKMHFALPYRGDGVQLRLIPSESEGVAEITKALIYCLPS